MKNDPNCSLCRLHKTTDNVCILGDGPRTCDIMIIGEAPGKSEEQQGLPFVGKSGKLLMDLLKKEGLRREDTYICNAVSCRPPDNRTPSKGEIKACKKWLDYQIAMVRPKFVLLVGNVPLIAITGKPGIKARRGVPFEQDGIIFLPTYHPAATFHDPTLQVLIAQDIKLFGQIIDAGHIPREDNLNIRIILTQKDMNECLDDLNKSKLISVDVETNSLYQWGKDKKVVSIGIGTASYQWVLPTGHKESPWDHQDAKSFLEEIDEVIDSRGIKIVGHNFKFDALWLWVHYDLLWHNYCAFDTMLAHYILDENSFHSLKLLAQKFCGAPNWDVDAKLKKGESHSLKRHALYLAHDIYYTRALYFVFKKELAKEPSVKRVFDEIIMPCSRQFTEIEYDGVFLNMLQFDEAEKVLRQQFQEAEAELQQWGNINWGSPKQVCKLLFETLKIPVLDRTKSGAPSASESVIQRIDHPCAGAMLRFRAAKQQLSFFIEGWKPFLDGNYLHPSFKIHGTVTGRLSCEHPNLQQVPRDPRIRTLITAPEGWTLVECDLSQIELRIAAELANERHMIEAFQRNIDVHWLTAIREISRSNALKELVLDTARTARQDKTIKYSEAIEILLEMGPDAAADIRVEWKETRKKAKAINFGYLYGMWWRKFKLYARDNYGVDVTDEEAQDSRVAFFDLYSDFPDWHRRQGQYARRNGYVRSLSGRKRRLPKARYSEDTPERREALRQAINSPVQSFANDINLMAAIQLRQEFGRNVIRICGTVHDAILLRVKTEYVEQVTRRLLKIMQRPKLFDVFEIDIRTPIEAEAKIGPWGAGINLEKWLKQNKVPQRQFIRA
jgi:uracil-DNA glycosylase family 4